MDDKGNIRDLPDSEHEALYQKRLLELQGRMRHAETPITEREAAFFRSKGQAFRALWGKRLARGLTHDQHGQLSSLILDFERKVR